MDEYVTTNLVEGEAMPEPEVETAEGQPTEEPEAQEAEEVEVELDEEGNPVEPEPEVVDFEFEGHTLKLTAEQKEALEQGALRQADYTRKTQEVAEKRKELETLGQGHRQASQAEVQAQQRLMLIDAQLGEYRNINWHGLDAQQANALRADMDALKDQREQTLAHYQQANQQRQVQEQQIIAKRLEEGRAELVRSIPGWSDDMAKALVTEGQKNYGFSEEEIRSEMDPRIVRALADANAYRKLQTKNKAVSKAASSQKAKPARKVRGGKAPVKDLRRVSDPEEYRRLRMEQLNREG